MQSMCICAHAASAVEFYSINLAYIKTTCIRETAGRVRLQVVKTQMKCSIMRHFVRVYTVCKGIKDHQTNEYNIF